MPDSTEHPPDLDRTQLPRIPAEEVRLLWVDGFYDGPLEGIAEYQGQRCLYLVAEPDRIAARDEERSWVLYRLTDEQLREQERWHALFVKHVGGHFDYTGTAYPEQVRKEESERFYGPYQSEYRAPQLHRDQALGWFDAFVVTR